MPIILWIFDQTTGWIDYRTLKNGVSVPELSIQIRWFCGVLGASNSSNTSAPPFFELEGYTPEGKSVVIGPVSLYDIHLKVKGYSGGGGGGGGVDLAGTFTGFMTFDGAASLGDAPGSVVLAPTPRLGEAPAASDGGPMLVTTTDIVFDTRTGDFGVTISVAVDLALLTANLKMTYNAGCGPGDAQTLDGDVKFKPGGVIKGKKISRRHLGYIDRSTHVIIWVKYPYIKISRIRQWG